MKGMKRIVVTGGPGAGKTASLETARRILCGHVGFAPESASIVFGGGFPRETRAHSEKAAQRAIYRVQHELECLFEGHTDLGVLVCDRGTIDCAAYWPGDQAEFYRQLGTSREAELARYALVIHLRPTATATSEPACASRRLQRRAASTRGSSAHGGGTRGASSSSTRRTSWRRSRASWRFSSPS
jgi:hypothetical protein